MIPVPKLDSSFKPGIGAFLNATRYSVIPGLDSILANALTGYAKEDSVIKTNQMQCV